jgi:hypothetical protein
MKVYGPDGRLVRNVPDAPAPTPVAAPVKEGAAAPVMSETEQRVMMAYLS